MMITDLNFFAENNTELWRYFCVVEIEDPTAKNIEIIPIKTLKINNKLIIIMP